MSRIRGIKSVTTSETLDPEGNEIFLIDATNGDITFTMNIIDIDGEKYAIRRVDNTVNVVTIAGGGTQKIEGQDFITLNPDEYISLLSYGNNWWKVSSEILASGFNTGVNIISDVKSNNTPGGTFTSGSYQIRTLNTLTGNGPATLLSNQFTLPAGTYIIKSLAPCFGVGNNQSRLFNVTNSTVDALGTSETSRIETVSGTLVGATVKSKIVYYVVLGNSTTYQIEHQCTITQNDTGFGEPCNFGNNEVYTIVIINKIA